MRDGLPSVIGHYALERELGRGGMGAVFVARDTRLDRRVALKVMLHSLGMAAQERFEREAQAVAALDHPGIVRIHQLGRHEGRAFIVMDLVEGESLQALLSREGPLPVERAVTLTRALAQAVQHAHARQILHRDIKPANVLIDAQGRAILSDFGLARDLSAARERLTLTGELVGTPAFMAPEQADGKQAELGPWTDVYGLGATLFCMLTGRAPFEGQGVNLLYSVLSADAPAPSSLRPELAEALDVVCSCALAKKHKHRYPSASALAEDLERFLSGERLAAKPLRRRSPLLWLGVALGIAGACALGLAAYVKGQRSRALAAAEADAIGLVAEADGALRGPPARDSTWADGWRQRRARVEAILPPEAEAHGALDGAAASVLTVEGLLSVDAGELGAARHTLTGLGESSSKRLLADAIAAVTTSADHRAAMKGLRQARNDGYRWPSLERWLAEAQLRTAHGIYVNKDRPIPALRMLQDLDLEQVSPALREHVWRAVCGEVRQVRRAIERRSDGHRISDRELGRFQARLDIARALRPAQPLPPDEVQKLVTLILDPGVNWRLRFIIMVSALAPKDYEVQRAVLDRRTFMNRDPKFFRALSTAFVPVARRALEVAPPGERAVVLDALGDLLHGALRYEDLDSVATELLAVEGLPTVLQAKGHYFRSCYLHHTGKLQEALEAATQSLELHPLPMASFRRSKLYYTLAEENRERARRSKLPEEAKALRAIYREEYTHAAEEAQAFLQRVDLKTNPELSSAVSAAAQFAFTGCRSAAKRQAYRAARRVLELYLQDRSEAEFAGWWLRLAHTQVHLREWKEARASLEKALELGEGSRRLTEVLEAVRKLLLQFGEKGTTGRMDSVTRLLQRLQDPETRLP